MISLLNFSHPFCLLSSLLPIFSPWKTMSELRICKLVEATRSRHTKISPNVLGRSKIELLDSPAARLESFVWILTRNSSSNDVTVRLRFFPGLVKVNWWVPPWALAIELPNALDTMQRNSHCNLNELERNISINWTGTGINCKKLVYEFSTYLELWRGKVYIRHHLSTRMFNLESWIEFKEEVISVCVVEVLNGTSTYVAHHFGQSDCSLKVNYLRVSKHIICVRRRTAGRISSPSPSAQRSLVWQWWQELLR